ncbi:MAG: diaminopimelate epimerase [Chromatiales bacterium]|nr:diaminopimelate epimerase [Chromatiales bacterium]
MRLRFAKMHGLGNDFIVLDATHEPIALSGAQIRALADRHRGIGFDQLLVVQPASSPDLDFDYRIFNADGGEVEQCGNGARCFAHFVQLRGLTDRKALTVGTLAGRLRLFIEDNGQITVDMGQPEFDPARIPLRAPAQAAEYSLEINGQSIRFGAVSMGNPHAVIAVDNIDNAPVTTLGPQIETHADFPKRVNVGFAQFTSPSEIQLRVWERGVGETQACGSGACAAVAVGRRQGRLDERVRIHLPGGTLSVSWAGPGEPVWMTGPASYVFDGEVEI